MVYEDRTIECADCSTPFVFSVRDQEYYAEKGFTHPPKRCRPCRQAKKAHFEGVADGETAWFDTICANCGNPARVPFKPKQGRPVYCHPCYQARANT